MSQPMVHITPKKAQELLKRDGIIVSEKEAGELAEFLYLVGDLIIDRYLTESKRVKNSITLHR